MIPAVRIRLAAKFDIADAEDWYEERVPGLGLGFRAAAYEAINTIASDPLIYPEVLWGNRRLVMHRFPYNIWFRASATEVLIVAVLHGKRGTRAIRSKLKRLNPPGP